MFVALDLPEGSRRALAEWRDELVAGRRDLRPVAEAALHATLVFLGWQAEKDVERIAAAAFGSVGALDPPRLTAKGVKPLPPRRPRLFALNLADEDDRATTLQSAMSRSLEAERFYKPEKRPFWPHITLARVKRGERAEALPELPPPDDPFEAADLTLYRSTLRPQGALYELLARARVGEQGVSYG
jgi:RNA 2',3'-cyclic 3'-phosphodiesterase